MNEIVITLQNGQAVVSSRDVAERFGKEHKHVLDSIRNLVDENSAAKSMFHETEFDNRGKKYPMYLMNRDGFSLLAMGFTGREALEWKIKYINAFNQMEKEIRNQQRLPDARATEMRAQAMLKNAQTRQFNAIMKAASDPRLSSVAAEVFGIAALECMTGREIAYRPQVEKTYSAGDLAKEFGVSGAMIGIIANRNDLKTPEYGMWVLDKARGHDKQVQNFRYNEHGRGRIRALLQELQERKQGGGKAD